MEEMKIQAQAAQGDAVQSTDPQTLGEMIDNLQEQLAEAKETIEQLKAENARYTSWWTEEVAKNKAMKADLAMVSNLIKRVEELWNE